MKEKLMKYLPIGLAVLLLGGLYFFKISGDSYEEETIQVAEETFMISQREQETTEAQEICVYISGAVKNPGVYTLSAKSRVYEVIQKAGGLLPEADSSMLNQAEKLMDGAHIHIPLLGESGSASESPTASEQVNLNLATKEELMTLSGIGESKALAIIDYRENSGAFTEISEITKVSGIGASTFEKIKNKICV